MTGAVAVYDPVAGALVTVWDIPVNKTKKGRSTETEVCAVTLCQNLADAIAEYGVCAIIIEDVHSSPQMGVVSAFNFGDTAGQIKAVAKMLHTNVLFVSPQKWKARMGLSGHKIGDKSNNKKVALEKARTLFGASPWLLKEGDHNKAEAALLALHGVNDLLDGVLPTQEVDPLS